MTNNNSYAIISNNGKHIEEVYHRFSSNVRAPEIISGRCSRQAATGRSASYGLKSTRGALETIKRRGFSSFPPLLPAGNSSGLPMPRVFG